MAGLLEKLRNLFSSSTPAVNEKALPLYIRGEDPQSCWLTADFIGDGAYGEIYKVYTIDWINYLCTLTKCTHYYHINVWRQTEIPFTDVS